MSTFPFRHEEELAKTLERFASFTGDLSALLRQLDGWEQERLLVDLRKFSEMLDAAASSMNAIDERELARDSSQ